MAVSDTTAALALSSSDAAFSEAKGDAKRRCRTEAHRVMARTLCNPDQIIRRFLLPHRR